MLFYVLFSHASRLPLKMRPLTCCFLPSVESNRFRKKNSGLGFCLAICGCGSGRDLEGGASYIKIPLRLALIPQIFFGRKNPLKKRGGGRGARFTPRFLRHLQKAGGEGDEITVSRFLLFPRILFFSLFFSSVFQPECLSKRARFDRKEKGKGGRKTFLRPDILRTYVLQCLPVPSPCLKRSGHALYDCYFYYVQQTGDGSFSSSSSSFVLVTPQ